MQNDPENYVVPGTNVVMAKPPVKRRNRLGQYDIETPDHLLDTRENFTTVLTLVENRHPDEAKILEHYAEQYVLKREGKYNPLEDPPVMLDDLLPRIAIVVNKTFSEKQIILKGEQVVKEYVDKLKAFVDVDIISVPCGKPLIYPQHITAPREYRDKIFNAQMSTFYKKLDKGAEDLLKRVIESQETAKRVNAEKEKEFQEKHKEITFSSSPQTTDPTTDPASSVSSSQ
jgi:hypothetical protein